MSDNAKFESALDRLAASLKDVFRELHAAAPVPVAAAVAPAAVAPVYATAPLSAASTTPGTMQLCTGFGRILAAANQTDIMQALLDSASAYAPRCAVLVVKGDRLAAWRLNGFDESAQAGWRSLTLQAEGDSGWRMAMNAVGSIPRSVATKIFEAAGPSRDGKAYLTPLLVRERAVAVFYGDCGSTGDIDEAAVRLLVRTAGIRLEMISGGVAKAAAPAAAAPAAAAPVAVPAPVAIAPPVVAAPAPVVAAVAAPVAAPAPVAEAPAAPAAPAPRKVVGPDLTNVPVEDQDSHKKAFRFAKLLVDELMLYNKDKVALGKQQRDVYSLLSEDIDKSRMAYEKKFANTPAAKVDYFHQQMVSQIGGGDPAAIGSGYPGPLV